MTVYNNLDELLAAKDKDWPKGLDRKTVTKMSQEEREDLEYWLPYIDTNDNEFHHNYTWPEAAVMCSTFGVQLPLISVLHEGTHVLTLEALGGQGHIESVFPQVVDRAPYLMGGQVSFDYVPNKFVEQISLIAPDLVSHTAGFLVLSYGLSQKKLKSKLFWTGMGVIYLGSNAEAFCRGGDSYLMAKNFGLEDSYLLPVAIGVSAAGYLAAYGLSKGIRKLGKSLSYSPQSSSQKVVKAKPIADQ